MRGFKRARLPCHAINFLKVDSNFDVLSIKHISDSKIRISTNLQTISKYIMVKY
jgi:hypothetical protein